MKPRVGCLVFSWVVLTVCSAVGEVTDEALRSHLVDVLMNDHDYRYEAAALFAECGSDSNRFVRIAKEVYAEALSARERTRVVSLIAKYAAPSDVAFLGGCVADAQVGLPALSGVLRLQGICSNSVAQIARFCEITNVAGNAPTLYRQQGFAVVNLLRDPLWSSSTSGNRALAWEFATSFLSNNVSQVRMIDEAMRRADPAYVFCKRRLALMRWADVQTLTSQDRQFVTNAISELVSYPEANLPE